MIHGDCGATQNHEIPASPEITENSKEAIKHLKHLLWQSFDLVMRHCHLQVHTQELSDQKYGLRTYFKIIFKELCMILCACMHMCTK